MTTTVTDIAERVSDPSKRGITSNAELDNLAITTLARQMTFAISRTKDEIDGRPARFGHGNEIIFSRGPDGRLRVNWDARVWVPLRKVSETEYRGVATDHVLREQTRVKIVKVSAQEWRVETVTKGGAFTQADLEIAFEQGKMAIAPSPGFRRSASGVINLSKTTPTETWAAKAKLEEENRLAQQARWLAEEAAAREKFKRRPSGLASVYSTGYGLANNAGNNPHLDAAGRNRSPGGNYLPYGYEWRR